MMGTLQPVWGAEANSVASNAGHLAWLHLIAKVYEPRFGCSSQIQAQIGTSNNVKLNLAKNVSNRPYIRPVSCQ